MWYVVFGGVFGSLCTLLFFNRPRLRLYYLEFVIWYNARHMARLDRKIQKNARKMVKLGMPLPPAICPNCLCDNDGIGRWSFCKRCQAGGVNGV